MITRPTLPRANRLLLAVLLLASKVTVGSSETIYWPDEGLDLAKQRASSITCVNHLREIGVAARIWAGDNSGVFPPSLQVLAEDTDYQGYDYLGPDPSPVFCPANVGRQVPTNWTDVDWSNIDYTYYPGARDWQTTNILCACNIHSNFVRVDGSVGYGFERAGWPAVVATAIPAWVAPNSDALFKVRIAPDALQPVSYQWRQEYPYYATNVFQPDSNPAHWWTNVVLKWSGTNLVGETNSDLHLHAVQTNQAGFYGVTVSNSMGTTSTQVRLTVDSAVSQMITNEEIARLNCVNNLRQIQLLANLWASDHQDQMPTSLSEMTNRFGLPIFGWPTVLFCRSDKTRTAPADWQDFDFTNTSYEVVPGDPGNPNAVFCRCTIHGFYVTMNGTVLTAPRFSGVHLTNNSIELDLEVFDGRTNVLEASADLVTWTNLAMYSSTNGIIPFYQTKTLPRRFYRLRLQ